VSCRSLSVKLTHSSNPAASASLQKLRSQDRVGWSCQSPHDALDSDCAEKTVENLIARGKNNSIQESLPRTYRAATGDSTWSCECSFRGDAVGRAAPSSSEPVLFFSSLSVMFAVRVGADCI